MHDRRKLSIIGADVKYSIPMKPQHETLFTEKETYLSGYPRIPILQFRHGDMGKWITYVYVLTPDNITEFHKHSSRFIGADINRVSLSIDTVEPILRAIMITGRVASKSAI